MNCFLKSIWPKRISILWKRSQVTGFILFVVFHIGKGKREGTSKTDSFLIKAKYMFKNFFP